jgi:hypothetical protein
VNAKEIFVMTCALLTLNFLPANADSLTVTTQSREAHVAELKTIYLPQYDAQYARLMAIKTKAFTVSSLKKSFNTVMEDFLEVQKTVYGAWADPLADADAAASYSDEEIGEFEISITYLERQVSKIANITCVKGKVTKKITDLSPKCPTGYVKKK